MEHAIKVLDETPTNNMRKLWDSSIEEILQSVAREIEYAVHPHDFDNYEVEMIKYILLKGHQVVIEHKKGIN